jgi:hypothetical protein
MVCLSLDSLFCPVASSLAHKTWITQQVYDSLVMGMEVTTVDVPHINYPLLVVCHFLMQNKKMVIGLIHQLPISLGGIVKVDRLNLRRNFQPLPLHICIDID